MPHLQWCRSSKSHTTQKTHKTHIHTYIPGRKKAKTNTEFKSSRNFAAEPQTVQENEQYQHQHERSAPDTRRHADAKTLSGSGTWTGVLSQRRSTARVSDSDRASVKSEHAEDTDDSDDHVLGAQTGGKGSAGRSQSRSKSGEGREKLPKWKRRSADRHKQGETHRRNGEIDRF